MSVGRCSTLLQQSPELGVRGAGDFHVAGPGDKWYNERGACATGDFGHLSAAHGVAKRAT